MRSLKEKGWRPDSNDAFKICNIYRRLYGWVATIQTSKIGLLQKGKSSIFNIRLSYLLFLLNVPVFSFVRLTIKFSTFMMIYRSKTADTNKSNKDPPIVQGLLGGQFQANIKPNQKFQLTIC